MKLLATRKMNGKISHKDTTVVEKQKITENLNNYVTNIGSRGGSRAAATSKMECFVIIVNYYHKAPHLGCCSIPRSASGSQNRI